MKIDRLMAMIGMLLERDTISIRELAERLEVSRRTVFRDIDTLMLAGLPIFTRRGAQGGVGLMPGYKLDKRLFTPGEIGALSAGLVAYRQLLGGSELAYLREKLNAIRSGDFDAAASRFDEPAVDLTPNRGNRYLRTRLEVIRHAIEERCLLLFGYRDRQGKVRSRRVEPYLTVFKENSWYLQAFCRERKDFRIFKIARMNELRASEERYEPREFTPLPMNGDLWMSRATVDVKIRLSLSEADRVVERFGEDHILQIEEETCLALYPIVDNKFGYDRLLALGDRCEVMEPPEVRDKFQQYVRGILEKYAQDSAGSSTEDFR